MRENVILVIDDDEMNLQIAKMILERKLPCKVIGVDNGLDGIETLKTQRVNLVLLDVMMPDFDGIETLQEIRNDEKIKNVPVMMLTASGDIEVIQKVGELGVKDYIKKPFMPADLVDRVSKKLEELKPGEKVLLLGDDKKVLQEMQEIIEESFGHEVLIAKDSEEILEAENVILIIACADMKFIDGVKILRVISESEELKAIPFALTMPDKLRELLDKIKPELIEEPTPVVKKKVEKPATSVKTEVVRGEKQKLGKVVTNFIGYQLDRKI